MNSNALKINWKVETDKPLEIGKNYSIALQGSIIKTEVVDNHDGTFINISNFRPINCLIHDELGNTITSKDPRKNSEKLRSYLSYQWSQDSRWYNTPEEHYNAFYASIYKNMDYLISQL